MFDMKFYEDKLKIAKSGDGLLCQNMSDQPYIAVTETSEFNNPDNYLVIHSKHVGGVGLYFPRDLGFTWVSNKSLMMDIIQEINFYFSRKGIRLSGDNNDIMINGRKLSGTMSTKQGDNYYEGMFLSFNPDIDIIKSVCKKEMRKEPIGLTELGITPEEMIVFCQSLISKYGLREVE